MLSTKENDSKIDASQRLTLLKPCLECVGFAEIDTQFHSHVNVLRQ